MNRFSKFEVLNLLELSRKQIRTFKSVLECIFGLILIEYAVKFNFGIAVIKTLIIFIPRWLIMDVLLKVFLEHNGPLFTGCSLDDDNIQ